VSLGVITVLFAAIYKYLPDATIRWKDVWVGALVTAVLFVIAKFALGLYFGNTDPASAYGAAGSIVLIMLWVTYSGLILFFGAEFTLIYANRYGASIRPVDYAKHKDEEKGAKDGSPAVHLSNQSVEGHGRIVGWLCVACSHHEQGLHEGERRAARGVSRAVAGGRTGHRPPLQGTVARAYNCGLISSPRVRSAASISSDHGRLQLMRRQWR